MAFDTTNILNHAEGINEPFKGWNNPKQESLISLHELVKATEKIKTPEDFLAFLKSSTKDETPSL